MGLGCPTGVNRIRVLPDALASQIAAGEVVERPASAAKELIENALDARATRCDVTCRGGGTTLLSVADNGIGMAEADARLALVRHATSKLAELSELTNLQSFGFRGEALPSIASVSRLSLRTRVAESELGVLLETEGGGTIRVQAMSLPVGTTVEVSDLFFNVPARRKFLRSTGTESAHVTSVVEGAALCRPEVTFTLTRDGRLVKELLRVETRADRVNQLLPDEDLAKIAAEQGPLRVEAHLSRPERARPGAAGLWLVVNGRTVKDRMLATTVAQSYASVLEAGNYPRGVVYLDLPLPLVDVNVHPQKTEVRFAEPRALADALYSTLSRGLAKAFSLPTNRGSRAAYRAPGPGFVRRPDGAPGEVTTSHWSSPLPVREPGPPRDGWQRRTESALDRPILESGPETGSVAIAAPLLPHCANQSAVIEGPTQRVLDGTDALPESVPAGTTRPELGTDRGLFVSSSDRGAPAQPSSTARWRDLRFLAQARHVFLLCEGPDGLYIIDQHAAAERVTFHRLLIEYRARAIASQTLLFPVTVQLSAEEIEIIEERVENLEAVGLEIRVRGVGSVTVHSVPRLIHKADPERLLRDLLGELSRARGRAFSSAVERALAVMACHGSIRAGDSVKEQQAQALLAALDETDFPGHCPHGRPVVAVVSFSELERKVGRH